MKRSRLSWWVPVVAALIVVGIITPVWLLAPRVVVRVDFVARPISRLADLSNGTTWACYESYVIEPSLDSEMANTAGNLYAPDILVENGTYKMWYGAQSSSGHDSIHFATSADGVHWTKYGVVIPTSVYNHVNDPSVVRVNDTYYMYYSVAPEDEMDQVWCATSQDCLFWTIQGAVILPAVAQTSWDSLKVGRPSVLYQDGVFKMWFDGTQRDASNPKAVAPGTGRHVGFANSTDGFTWVKYPANPVFNNSGAIDVEFIDGKFVVVEESRVGVFWRVGTSETSFSSSNTLLFGITGTDFDPYGHVTPFILVENSKWVATYTGAATRTTWNGNRIAAWYPCANITLNLGGNSMSQTAFIPRAKAKNVEFWDLDTSYISVPFSLEYVAGAQKTAVISGVLQSGTCTYFLAENGTQFLALS